VKRQTIDVKGNEVSVIIREKGDFISLTDIAKYKNIDAPADIVKNWMRNRSTIDFIGLWEKLNNPDFKLVEFDRLRNESGTNYFVLSPLKWIETTNAAGIISKSGKYGGTFAHKDIAFEFASWISPEFKLYLIWEFQRLKDDENSRLNLEWNLQRTISKINYRIHTDAIKENLIPQELSSSRIRIIYASEADILNMAMFGMTAAEWREKNPDLEGNIRDYASLTQLVVLSNLESINSMLIQQNVSQQERLMQLNKMAIIQMKSLVENTNIKRVR